VSYRLAIDRAALKALSKLDKPIRRRVQAAIDRLADQPRPPGCRKLTGQDVWRIKAAHDWRILYEIHDDVLTVVVVEIAHRSSAYRNPT
jgi:mRNA interferase RelE/StbE